MLVRFFREDQGVPDQPENPLKHHVMNWSENGSYALTSLNAVTFDNATRQWVENRTIPFVLMVKAFQANRTGRKILGGDNRSSSMTYCSVSSVFVQSPALFSTTFSNFSCVRLVLDVG